MLLLLFSFIMYLIQIKKIFFRKEVHVESRMSSMLVLLFYDTNTISVGYKLKGG